MFANLKKKIQEGGTIYENPDRQGGPGVASPSPRDASESLGGRTASIDSLESVGEQMRSGRRREEHVKKLETKISELAALVREKNAKINELDKAAKQAKEEHDRASAKMKESFMSEIEKVWADHKKELEESLKMRDQFEEQLRAAEQNIDSYRKRFFDKEEESGEIQDLTMQELAKLKHMLLLRDRELQEASEALSSARSEAESFRKDAEFAKREVEAKQQLLSKLQEDRLRDSEERRSLQTTIKGLLNEKDDLEQKLDEMNSNLTKTRSMLSNVERSSIQAQDKFQVSQRELEALRVKFASLQEEKADIEEDLKDRVRILESRLSEVDMGADDRLEAVQKQRRDLESKLAEAKAQVADSRTTWGERVRVLEAQISNLNEKMAEDAAELALNASERKEMAAGFERQIADLQQRVKEAEAKVVELEEALGSSEHKKEREKAIREQLTEELRVADENFQERSKDIAQQLDSSRSELRKMKSDAATNQERWTRERRDHQDAVAKVEKELSYVKEQLSVKVEEAESLERDRFSKELKLTELKADLARKEVECEEARKKLETARSECRSLQKELRGHLDNKKTLVSSLEAARAETEAAKTEAEAAKATAERRVTAMQRECELAALTTRELQEKLQDIESERETVIVKMEREEIVELKSKIQGLESHLQERNKTVKLLQQRLADLKKAFQRELRVQTLPNEEPAVTGRPQSHNRVPSNEGLPANGFAENSPPRLASASASSEAMADNLLLAGFGGSMEPPGNQPLSALSQVNFAYLKHVVLKFLLSRESEAIHLIKAIATLLRFTPDEERLLRETLEYKMSWFGARPKRSSQGQRSKYIPPYS